VRREEASRGRAASADSSPCRLLRFRRSKGGDWDGSAVNAEVVAGFDAVGALAMVPLLGESSASRNAVGSHIGSSTPGFGPLSEPLAEKYSRRRVLDRVETVGARSNVDSILRPLTGPALTMRAKQREHIGSMKRAFCIMVWPINIARCHRALGIGRWA
jgi:hypothetical protein